MLDQHALHIHSNAKCLCVAAHHFLARTHHIELLYVKAVFTP